MCWVPKGVQWVQLQWHAVSRRHSLLRWLASPPIRHDRVLRQQQATDLIAFETVQSSPRNAVVRTAAGGDGRRLRQLQRRTRPPATIAAAGFIKASGCSSRRSGPQLLQPQAAALGRKRRRCSGGSSAQPGAPWGGSGADCPCGAGQCTVPAHLGHPRQLRHRVGGGDGARGSLVGGSGGWHRALRLTARATAGLDVALR